MSKVPIGKVLLGGVLAGVVLCALDYLVQNYVLATDWENAAHLRNVDLYLMGGPNALILMCVIDFVLGQILVLTYAAIRPRFGPGAGTATIAGFLMFVPLALSLATFAGVFISWELYVRQTALTLVATVLAALAGAWIYGKEDGDPVD
jgi:hypothetical protein